jgi:hypothetical protein
MWSVAARGRRRVERGQRYRSVREGGVSMPIVWEIVEVYTLLNNGIEHARLRRVDDPSEARTLATSVVTDPGRFVRQD